VSGALRARRPPRDAGHVAAAPAPAGGLAPRALAIIQIGGDLSRSPDSCFYTVTSMVLYPAILGSISDLLHMIF